MIRSPDISETIIKELKLTPDEVSNHDALCIKYKQQSIGSEQKIEISTSQNHIVLYTELPELNARPEFIPNLIQLTGRINDYLQIGCLEMTPETKKFQLKTGQIIHPSTNCIPILRNFIEYHNTISPKIIDSIKQIIFHGKPPIEAINALYSMN